MFIRSTSVPVPALLRGNAKAIALIAALMLMTANAFAADSAHRSVMAKLKARIPFNKHSALLKLNKGQDADQLVIKFNEGTQVRLRNSRLVSESSPPLPPSANVTIEQLEIELAELNQRLDNEGLTLKRLFHLNDDRLSELKQEGEARGNSELADLSLFFLIQTKQPEDAATMEKVRSDLNTLSCVEIAYFKSRPGHLPDAGTPDFSGLQNYKGPAPLGVDADYANTIAGGRGEGVSVIDIEAGWNVNHEDLPDPTYTFGRSNTDDAKAVDHGTASLGVVAALDNGFGTTGIAPGATVGYSSVYALDGTARGIHNALIDAIDVLTKGDVIFIEHQVFGPDIGDCICKPDHCNGIAAEYDPDVFSGIQIATAKGITVVEAAGNGSVNLDHAQLNDIFDPAQRDSGAIMVGAGQSAKLKPMCFSNYGDRVDVNAWGEKVVTTGYGNLYAGSLGLDDEYYSLWGGTSSATAITAGVVAALQGVAIDTLGDPLEPAQVRGLLRATGSPQAAGLGRQVGARSDLRRAIDRLKKDRRTPIAAFHVTCDDQANCTYRDTSFDFSGAVTGWTWTFDDGATRTGSNPTHTYFSFGDHPVTLTVTDNDGNSDTVTVATTIRPIVCSDPQQIMFKDFEDEQDMEGFTTSGIVRRSDRSGAAYEGDWALALFGTAGITFTLDVSNCEDFIFNGRAKGIAFDQGEVLYFQYCPLDADGQCDPLLEDRREAAITGYEKWVQYSEPYYESAPEIEQVRVVIGSTANANWSEYAYIDNLEVMARVCAPVECLSDDWCDNENGNGRQRCVAGACVCGCATNSDCDDGQFCNGVEICDAVGSACLPGSDPCPGQTCDEQTDSCRTDTTCLSETATISSHVQAGRAYSETARDCSDCSLGCYWPSGCAVSTTTYYCTDASDFNWPLGTDPGMVITLTAADQGAGWSPWPCITPCTSIDECADDGLACTEEFCNPATGQCDRRPMHEDCPAGGACELPYCDINQGCVLLPIANCCGNGNCENGEDSCNCATDCSAPPATETGLCSDAIDNDCDGLVDGDDTADCADCANADESCSSDGDCCQGLTCGGWPWRKTCR